MTFIPLSLFRKGGKLFRISFWPIQGVGKYTRRLGTGKVQSIRNKEER